jgi:hypothetical protein
MTSPYLEPVAAVWARIAGGALLVSATGLTALLAYDLFQFMADEEFRRQLTISSVLFALILLVLCGICWQAGYRLAFDRPDRSGTLFSWPAWFAIGTVLIVMAVLMAATIVSARQPTVIDLGTVLSLGAFGIWCLILAYRSR